MNENPLEIFVAEDMIREGRPFASMIKPQYSEIKPSSVFYNYSRVFPSLFRIATGARYIVLPHNIKWYSKEELMEFLSRNETKTVLTFNHGDREEKVLGSNQFLWQTSNSGKSKNAFTLPSFVSSGQLELKEKPSKPTISFIGKTHYSGLFQFWKIRIREFFLNGLTKDYITIRKEIVNELRKIEWANVNCVVRKSKQAYSKQDVQDFKNSFSEADFVVAPRGAGNYSYRFYESLTHGRIPILIADNAQLPFYSDIPYEQFILTISPDQIATMGSMIKKFFQATGGESYKGIQQKCFHYWQDYLSPEGFYSNLKARLETNGKTF